MWERTTCELCPTQQSWSENCTNHPGIAQTHLWHWLFKYWTTEGGHGTSPVTLYFLIFPSFSLSLLLLQKTPGSGSKLCSPRLQPFTSFQYSGWIGSYSLYLWCFLDITCSRHALPAWRTYPANVPDCRTELQPFSKNSLDIWDTFHIFIGSKLNWKWPYCLTYILVFTQPHVSPFSILWHGLGRWEGPKTLHLLWQQFSLTLLYSATFWFVCCSESCSKCLWKAPATQGILVFVLSYMSDHSRCLGLTQGKAPSCSCTSCPIPQLSLLC